MKPAVVIKRYATRPGVCSLRYVGALLLITLLAGCGDRGRIEAVAETEERNYQRGQQMLREDRKDEALAAFLRVVDVRRDAPESHLEAGRLYHEHIGDPVAGIYHYRKFIELQPSAEQTPMVKQMIETAQKDFARSLPAQPFQSHLDRLDLLEIISQLREENAALKDQVAASRRGVAVSAASPQSRPSAPAPERQQASQPRQRTQEPSSPSPAPETPPASGRTFTVRQGDTLSRISTEVYGTSARWMDIYQANRDVLPSPNSLRPGQELRIP